MTLAAWIERRVWVLGVLAALSVLFPRPCSSTVLPVLSCGTSYLQVFDRQELIATCREADGWCLRHIRAYPTPSFPPLQTSLRFAGGRRVVLGRFARGVRMQRCKAAFFRRLGTLEPVFDGLDAMACEDVSATAASDMGTTTVERTLHDVVADLAHQVALQEIRLQALERQSRRS